MTISCKVYSNSHHPAQFGEIIIQRTVLSIQDAKKTKTERGYDRRPPMGEKMRTVVVRRVAEESGGPIDW